MNSKQRLDRIDLRRAGTLEIILDDVEQPAMQAFDQSQSLKIAMLDLLSSRLGSSRAHAPHSLSTHFTTSALLAETASIGRSPYGARLKLRPLKTDQKGG